MPLNLTLEQLNKPEFFGKIKKEVQDIVEFNLVSQAGQYYFALKKGLAAFPQIINANPEYSKLIINLQYIAFPILSEREIISFVKNNFRTALETDLNPVLKLESVFSLMPVLFRGGVKKQIREALKQNNQQLTSQYLKSGFPPSLSNWLKDYDQKTGGEKHTELEQAKYLFNDENAKNLSLPEKDLLKKLLKAYDYLKPLSFQTVYQWFQQAKRTLNLEEIITPEELERELAGIQKTAPLSPSASPLSIPSSKTPPPSSPPLSSPPQPQPKIEGNIVDLKNH